MEENNERAYGKVCCFAYHQASLYYEGGCVVASSFERLAFLRKSGAKHCALLEPTWKSTHQERSAAKGV